MCLSVIYSNCADLCMSGCLSVCTGEYLRELLLLLKAPVHFWMVTKECRQLAQQEASDTRSGGTEKERQQEGSQYEMTNLLSV